MKNGHWLNATRLRVYPRILLILYLSIGAGALLYWWFAGGGATQRIVSDLLVFWIAATFSVSGHPALAYDPAQIHHAMAHWAPRIEGGYGWFYPPTFLLMVTPMGWTSYGVAFFTFMGISLTGYVAALRKVMPDHRFLWGVATFPGIWINVLTGQNGLLTAALAGLALQVLESSPVLSGVLIGLLSIKPHLALLFPVALIALRAWKTLWVALLTGVACCGVSAWVLGPDTFAAWLHSLDIARAIMQAGGTGPMMPTAFAFMRLLKFPVVLAYGVQAVVGTWAVLLLWQVCRSGACFPLKAAALMTASLLVSPYLFEYDLAWLGFPIAWMTKCALEEQRWFFMEREILLLAWWLPLMTVVLAWLLHLQPGPWIVGLLLWIIARRALSMHHSQVHDLECVP